mmetsp:Transcript_44038/g.94368  ORF Transcript_44038/g.94368 Transcript_44038/m.94368 type:complete len:113 (+) Transcript_44038:3-341(+)
MLLFKEAGTRGKIFSPRGEQGAEGDFYYCCFSPSTLPSSVKHGEEMTYALSHIQRQLRLQLFSNDRDCLLRTQTPRVSLKHHQTKNASLHQVEERVHSSSSSTSVPAATAAP